MTYKLRLSIFALSDAKKVIDQIEFNRMNSGPKIAMQKQKLELVKLWRKIKDANHEIEEKLDKRIKRIEKKNPKKYEFFELVLKRRKAKDVDALQKKFYRDCVIEADEEDEQDTDDEDDFASQKQCQSDGEPESPERKNKEVNHIIVTGSSPISVELKKKRD